MSKFSMEFDMDNAAFIGTEAQEVGRILAKLGEALARAWEAPSGRSGGPLRDINGNTVGEWHAEID